MAYVLGIDVGTTFTSASILRTGHVEAEVVQLGHLANAIPSVVFLREDGEALVGEAAERRAVTDPTRVAREVKRRAGDTVPVILGGTSYTPQALLAAILRWVAGQVAEVEDTPPARVLLTCPATWGSYRRRVLTEAAEAAGLAGVELLAEPVAAATWYATRERVPAGALIAVYDLGGGTFDASVLRKTEDGFELLGQPAGDDYLGGVDFDQTVMDHVASAVGPGWASLNLDDPVTRSGVAQIRAAAVAAKESLSTDMEATISVILPEISRQVRLTRAELEERIRGPLLRSVETLQRALDSARVAASDLHAVLLTGGSSRIPLVSQLLITELGVPIATDAHPKFAVCLGAAIAAGRAAGTRPVPAGEPAAPTPAAIPAAGIPDAGPVPAPTPFPSDTPAPKPSATPASAPAAPPVAAARKRQAPPRRPQPRRLARLAAVGAGAALLVAVAGWAALRAADGGGSPAAEPAAASGAGTTASTAGRTQPAATATHDPVWLGFMGATTGEHAELGNSILNGVRLAVDQHNQRGGVPVRLQLYDTQGDPEKARALAQEAVRDGMVGVVGPAFSAESKTAMPVLEKAGIPSVSATATNPGLARNGWRHWHRVVPNDDALGPATGRFIGRRLGAKRVLVVHDPSAYGRELADHVATALRRQGATVTTQTTVSGRSTHPVVVRQARDRRVNAVFFAGDHVAAGSLLRALRAGGVRAAFVTGDDALLPYPEPFAAVAGAVAREAFIVCTCGFATVSEIPTVRTFIDAYKDAYSGAPTVFAAEAYDAASALLRGIEAGSTDRQGINDRLRTIRFDGASNRQIGFDARGELLKPVVQVHQLKGGEVTLLGDVDSPVGG